MLTNRKYYCKPRPNLVDCPWFDLNIYFLEPSFIKENLEYYPSEVYNYIQELNLGLKIRLCMMVSLYFLPIAFIYCNAKLSSKIRRERKIRQENHDISDYSLMVTSSEEEKQKKKNKENLKAYFQSLLSLEGYDDSVEFVNFFCTTERTPLEYLKVKIREINTEIDFISSRVKNGDFDGMEKEKLKKKIKKLERSRIEIDGRKEKLSRKFDKKSVPQDLPINQRRVGNTSVAFVTLPNPILRRNILRADKAIKARARLSCKKHPLKNQGVVFLKPAPKLDQIFWERATLPYNKQLYKIALIELLCVLIFAVLTYILIKIQDAVDSINSNQKTLAQQGFIKIYTILVIGYELTAKIGSLIYKQIGKISTGIVKRQFNFISLIIISALKFFLFCFSVRNLNLNKDILNPEVGTKVIFIVVTDSLIQGFVKLLGLTNIYKTSKMTLLCFRSKMQKRRLIMTQKELNEAFGKPECLIGYLCCFKLYMMFVATHYAPNSISLISLPCLFYLLLSLPIDRLILQRFYAGPNPRDVKVFKEFMYCFGFALCSYFTAADYYWDDYFGEIAAESEFENFRGVYSKMSYA